MDITIMTTEELRELKANITKEIHERYRCAFNDLKKTIINTIKTFEEENGLFIGCDMGDYEDTAINFIEDYIFYSDEYIEPYE